ncbi:hypothetical protein ECC02_005935 [Trypanosoma cruzi]|uniref:Protein OS9-like domain-containing protein n=1 Tax=Trypanosoma cruzi TaxID=5693 RepID=A0A7J6Y4R0_TRYCR|nr:hypothetical protein ECC02_005935 [Trypanosoma cruzi]
MGSWCRMLSGGVLRVFIAVSVLLGCVFAEDCELARQLRKNEMGLFNNVELSQNLKPSRTGCIAWNMGYWSYELCPGRWVRQYREVKEVIVEEYILGVQHRWRLVDEIGSQLLQYSDGFYTLPDRLRSTGTTIDAENQLYACAKESNNNNNKQVDVVYPDGSPCGKGFRRFSLLHFVCNENVHYPIVKLKEPAMCKYDITVVASTICEAMLGSFQAQIELNDAHMRFAI